MADTVRTIPDLQFLFRDGQARGAIKEQAVRDLVVTFAAQTPLTQPWFSQPVGRSAFANAQAANLPALPSRVGLLGQDAFAARELNFADYVDPSSFVDCTTALQNFLLYCQMVALTLKTTGLDDNIQRTYVRAYMPRGIYEVFCPIIVPEYVQLCCDGIIVRQANGGTAGTDAYAGDTTSRALNNIYQPVVCVTPRGHIERINFYCNPDGNTAHQGSGLAVGKNWVMSGVTLQSAGTGYSINDTITLANPSKAPLYGAKVTVNTIDGSGRITGYSMTDGGAYGLPSVLQAQQWTTANGFSVFDASGNYKVTGGGGSGATFAAAWTGDFASVSYYMGNTTLTMDTTLGRIRGQGVGIAFDGTTHGNQFGVQFGGLNHTYDEIQVVGGNIGVFFLGATDVRGSILNPVQCETALQFLGGGSIECPNVVIDSPTGTFLVIDNCANVALRGVMFTNFTLSNRPHGGVGAIVVGAHNTQASAGLDLDFTMTGTGTWFAQTVNPAISLAHVLQSSFNLKVRNGDKSASPFASHLINQFAQIGTGVDATVSLTGAIDNVAGAIFIDASGTPAAPACHVHVWDAAVSGWAKTLGVYEIIQSGAPTSGASGSGANKAGPGSRLTDISGANDYLNAGTALSPSWKLVTRAA